VPRKLPLSDDTLNVRLPRALLERLAEVAAANGRTRAGHIRWLLMNDVAAHDAAELAVAARGGGPLDPLPSKSNGAEGDGAAADDRGDGRRAAER
jgi:hypothetical protein